jgi:hypothetical protein
MTGLREDIAKEEKGRQFACPHCGAPIQVALLSTKSVTCASCKSIVSLAEGLSGGRAFVTQEQAFEPVIPLGSSGRLQGVDWQVVGYQHRMGHEPGDEDERFGWEEYLLYNRKRGFAFLIDSEDGWSLVRPTTGAPILSAGRQSAAYMKENYQLLYSYEAETQFVAGEFYWPVEQGQKSFNRDFAKGAGILSMEETPREVTWSAGSKLESDTVAAAFGLEGKQAMLNRGDSGPVLPGKGCAGVGCGTLMLIFIIVLIILLVIAAAMDDDNSSGYTSGGRTSSGSYGGYSGGGGHK